MSEVDASQQKKKRRQHKPSTKVKDSALSAADKARLRVFVRTFTAKLDDKVHSPALLWERGTYVILHWGEFMDQYEAERMAAAPDAPEWTWQMAKAAVRFLHEEGEALSAAYSARTCSSRKANQLSRRWAVACLARAKLIGEVLRAEMPCRRMNFLTYETETSYGLCVRGLIRGSPARTMPSIMARTDLRSTVKPPPVA